MVTVSAPRVGTRHRWVVLGLGVAAQASFSAMFSGLPVTGVELRAGYGLSTGALGFVVGCLGLGVAAGDIVWGLLTDRFGDRRILLTGLVSTGALMAAMALAAAPADGPGTPVLAACLFVAGALGGSVNGSSGRAVMTWFADDRRGLAMSIRQTAIPAGGAVGVALLPPLAAASGFRAVYAVLTGFFLLSAAATARWLHEPETERTQRKRTSRSPLRNRDVWRVALASGLLTVPQFAVLAFTAVFLHDARHADAAIAAAVVLIAQIGGGAARIWTGRRSDRGADRRTAIRVIGLLTAVAMAAAAATAHAPLPLTVAALATAGLLANAWHGVAYTEIAVTAGADRAGTALGLEGTTVFGAAFVTPLVVPALLGATSWTAVWAFAAVAPLLAVPLTPAAVRASGRAPSSRAGSGR
ncbi:Glycerol-3-phosphate transporter [Actinomadura rubteroloni]|uniref:Glycerol-3-phosphate transporter n=1 Tax=Actinomadura rubteroloni TaxID=1926885 RepID=A0A2P4UKF3_9ACTN|nr:MFS transporter [Actinomadura rubteroloni]POM25508.1 Glycerol-3-phosphate transporter [Actinomadura rubteroloni]